MSLFDYEGTRRIVFAGEDGEGGAYFIPVCEKCGRFVKADEHRRFNGEGQPEPVPDATCSIHGRINMIFEGWF